MAHGRVRSQEAGKVAGRRVSVRTAATSAAGVAAPRLQIIGPADRGLPSLALRRRLACLAAPGVCPPRGPRAHSAHLCAERT